MRYLILSDLHANWDAFAAVLRHVRRKRFDAILVLGDLVGYGAAPNQVVDAVRRLPGEVRVIRGNHDKVATGIEEGRNFNQAARDAARWTRGRLTAGNLRYVRDLPAGPVGLGEGIQMCHGSPLDEDNYVFSGYDAYEIFSQTEERVTFFGHTHILCAFALEEEAVSVSLLRGRTGTLDLDPERRYLLNPGSIGQPRDRDPRAAYMTYDSARGRVRWHRLDYPVARAQERILKAGLPRLLADRLALGA